MNKELKLICVLLENACNNCGHDRLGNDCYVNKKWKKKSSKKYCKYWIQKE